MTPIAKRYDPILPKIFEYLDIKDLRNSRLVCSSWNTAVKRKHNFCVVCESIQMIRSSKNYLNVKCISENDTPFSNYCVAGVELKNLMLNESLEETFTNFAAAASPHVTDLTVDGKFMDIWNVNKARCVNFAKLERLYFYQKTADNDADPGESWRSAHCFVKVSKNAPNLKALTLIPSGINSNLAILNEIQSLKSLANITVSLGTDFQLATFRNSLAKIKLESLNITFEYGPFSVDLLESVLESQKNTLKYFAFADNSNNEGRNDAKLKFPRMPILERLTIAYRFARNSSPLHILSCSEQLPALKKLVLCFHEANETLLDDFLRSRQPCKSVLNLQLPRWSTFDPRSTLMKVACLFPNLTKLDMSCDIPLKEVMIAAKMISQLEELTINLHYNEVVHDWNLCFPCLIGQNTLNPQMDRAKNQFDKEEVFHVLKLVELPLRESKLQSLRHIRFTCQNKELNPREFELIIKKKFSGQYKTTIQVPQGDCPKEKYWAEL